MKLKNNKDHTNTLKAIINIKFRIKTLELRVSIAKARLSRRSGKGYIHINIIANIFNSLSKEKKLLMVNKKKLNKIRRNNGRSI